MFLEEIYLIYGNMNLVKFLLRLMANDFYTIKVDTIHIPSLSNYLTKKTWLPKSFLDYEISFRKHGLLDFTENLKD